MKHFKFILLALMYYSCNNIHSEKQQNDMPKTPIDSIAYHQLKEDSVKSAVKMRLLKNINEPDLKNYNKECFRFILWQAFDPASECFRVEKDSMNKVLMTVKYFIIGYDENRSKDTLIREIKKDLTLTDWNTIIRMSQEAYFWTLEIDDNPERLLNDGSTWIIEAKRFPNRYEKERQLFKDYTCVNRRCPYKGSFYELGATIVTLSNEIKRKDLYPPD